MPHEVIMPALGMAQDTGLIVAWHRTPGDAVAATDVLLEVETDKATMDVEAGHDGYVAALLAEAGEEAPVGDVIALISAEKPDDPSQTSIAAKAAPDAAAKAAPEPGPAPAAKKREEPTAEAQPASPPRPAWPKAAPVTLDGPILASPKAKRLAAEQGLDLARLAAQGIPMPYHVADLETLRSLPAPALASAGEASSLHVSARVPRSGFAAFTDWLEGRASASAVWAAYAAASLRAATGAEALIVRVDQPLLGKASLFFTDPDQVPMSAAKSADVEAHDLPSLIIRDVTGSRITGGNLGVGAVPALTVATNGEDYALTLDFAPRQLDAEAAVGLLDGFAARLEEPLRHLL